MMKVMNGLVVLIVGILSLSYIPIANSLWNDAFILGYNYELTSSAGPNNWGSLAPPGGWGEWTQYEAGSLFNLAIQGNDCGSGANQSPLNLFQTATCPDTHEIITRRIRSIDCNRSVVTFDISPYSLRAYFPVDDTLCVRPGIVMSGVGDPFVLVWMELHARAEHVIDGRRYDAELQMVHLGTGNATTEMATVSLLIEASARSDNREFQWYLDQWQIVANGKSAQSCARSRDLQSYFPPLDDPIEFQLVHEEDQAERELLIINKCKPDRFGHGCEPLLPRKKMFPYNLWPDIWYFGYDGSIASPPCSPIVHWRVLDEPLRISRRQYKQLTSLLPKSKNVACQNDTAVSSKGENFRPIQQPNTFPAGVFHCTYANFSFLVYNSTT